MAGGGAPAGSFLLHSDGAARGNPGLAGAGAVLYGPDGEPVARLTRFLGETTNNVAEYQALIMGLAEALERGVRVLAVRLDSELIVRQLDGSYRVKAPGLKPLFEKARTLLGRFERVDVAHVPRADNAEADRLANLAIDRRGG